jgi:hypothetical protein
MPLTRAIAVAIVGITAGDPECRRRIDDGFFSKFGSMSGGARNLAYCIANLAKLENCAPDSKQQQKICHSIAEATVAAINKVVVTRPKPRNLASVRFASQIGRNVGQNGEHYAMKVILTQSDSNTFKPDFCVFDWWATLKSNDPLIYKTSTDFMNPAGGIPFSQFSVG